MNSWLEILKAFRQGKFPDYVYGLSPRFLIGACQTPIGKKFETESLALEATETMFDQMRVFNKMGLVVTSTQCDILNGPVMALSECKWSETAISTSFEEIWERYGNEIINGNYHINAKEQRILEDIFST